MMRRPVQLFATMILGMLLVGALPAKALQLAKVEAGQATVGTWGTVQAP